MEDVTYIPPRPKNALVVHPDVGALAVFQRKLLDAGMTPILARDLPTALLAIAQHRLDLCIVSSRIAEENDGWALTAVLHMCFPHAFIAVLANDLEMMTFHAAVNSGAAEVYLRTAPPADTAERLIHAFTGQSAPPKHRKHVQ